MKKNNKIKIVNKKANFEYEFLEKIEAGLVLTGEEAGALKAQRGDISQAFGKIIGNEAFLLNALIPVKNGDSKRIRKLLFHKREILNISLKIKKEKLTLIPIFLYNTHNKFKVLLGLGKARNKPQKRELLKKRDLEREARNEFNY